MKTLQKRSGCSIRRSRFALQEYLLQCACLIDCYIECKGAVEATYPSEWIESYTVKACCSDNWGMLTSSSYKSVCQLKSNNIFHGTWMDVASQFVLALIDWNLLTMATVISLPFTLLVILDNRQHQHITKDFQS